MSARGFFDTDLPRRLLKKAGENLLALPRSSRESKKTDGDYSVRLYLRCDYSSPSAVRKMMTLRLFSEPMELVDTPSMFWISE